MRINLREDETKNYMMLFQEFLERLQALNRKTMDVLNDEMRKSRYDKLQRTISNVIDAYMDVIVKTVQGNSFTAWEESEASLHACLDLYRAGEAAHAVCVLIEQQMKEQMEELLHIEKEAAVITDRPVVSEEGMEYIKDTLQAALSESEELKDEFAGKADSRAEENDIYGTLKPLFQSISVSISAFLEESMKKFEELHEFVREASSKIRAAAEDESQRAASSGHVQAHSGAGKETGGQSGARKGTEGQADIKDTEGKAGLKGTEGKAGIKDAEDINDNRENTNTERSENYLRKERAIKRALKAYATNMASAEKSGSFDEFRKVTVFLYNTILEEESKENKALSYEMISELTGIYKKFYQEYGKYLQDRFVSFDEREKFVLREYLEVTRDRGNDPYFANGDMDTFRSHASRTYMVFYTVADMVGNIARSCMKKKASNTNLVYGAYVLFNPILDGRMGKEAAEKYEKFSKYASKEILRIIGEKPDAANMSVKQNDAAGEAAGFKEEQFDEANVEVFVVIMEKLVGQTDIEKLNDYIEKNYASLSKNMKSSAPKKPGEQKTKAYKPEKKQGQAAAKAKPQKAKKQEQTSGKKNIYGRYTVTPESIHLMEELCRQADIERDKVNRFYGEKFRKREKSFTGASKIIHELSSFIEVWGSGKEEITKLFSADNSVKDILEAINKGTTLLKTATGAGSVVKAGAMAVQFLDKMLPNIQKSAILVKASEKLWKLTRSNVQASYLQRRLDVYMMEHYELKYGIDHVQTGWFEYVHDIILKLKDESIRRHFENALFAADMYLNPQNYVFRANSWQQVREISCGVYLNLVRSGLSSEQDMKAADANKLADQLYDIYLKREGSKARVDIDPMRKMIAMD